MLLRMASRKMPSPPLNIAEVERVSSIIVHGPGTLTNNIVVRGRHEAETSFLYLYPKRLADKINWT
jgi:hypothetical protein